MFENLIAQPAAGLLVDDIHALRLPPSMLFSGQRDSGKLTAALELARILSCQEGRALWTCTCPSCQRHKELTHPDLLIMGTRDCILEIRASSAAFLRSRSVASRYLFIRSVRKLVLRFNPALLGQDDSRFAKAASVLADIDEKLEELDPSRPVPEDAAAFGKIVQSVVDSAEKLEEEFMYESIPVNQVRSATSWARLTPSGKKKVLIIENADRMQESARNAFLKVLEEPPKDVVFILTTARRGAIMPTILSRVRTYAFVDRSGDAIDEVITRVFHDVPVKGEDLSRYFNRFLPVSPETVLEAACLFLDMVLIAAIDEGRKPLTGLKIALDAARASSPGKETVERQSGENITIASIVAMLNKCKPGIIWHLFLSCNARLMRGSIRSGAVDAHETAVYAAWTSSIRKAMDAVDIYNISPLASLEQLFMEMKEAL